MSDPESLQIFMASFTTANPFPFSAFNPFNLEISNSIYISYDSHQKPFRHFFPIAGLTPTLF
jgi:hypothetical protein